MLVNKYKKTIMSMYNTFKFKYTDSTLYEGENNHNIKKSDMFKLVVLRLSSAVGFLLFGGTGEYLVADLYFTLFCVAVYLDGYNYEVLYKGLYVDYCIQKVELDKLKRGVEKVNNMRKERSK
jgi:hypothetical protein